MVVQGPPNEVQLEGDARRKAANLNRYFFTAGLAGVPFCIWGDMRWHTFPWLIGLGVSVYFIVSSITDAVVRTRLDVQVWRRMHQSRGETLANTCSAPVMPPPVTPIRRSPYFRAGIMGLPFCIFEWLTKHTLVFLLGAGFFAGLLIATLFNQWSRVQVRNAATSADGSNKEGA